MQKSYTTSKGAHLKASQAKLFGKRISIMMKSLGRELTPKDIVDDARNKDSVFHSFFEWNNKKAAEKFRLEQAKYILRSVSVVFVTEDGQKTTQRAFVNITRKDALGESKQVYVNIERALTDADMRKQIIDRALDEALDWQARYKVYTELNTISKAIEKTAKKLHKSY